MRGLRKNNRPSGSPFVMTLVVVVMATFASPRAGYADATVDALFAALPDPRESPYDYRDRAVEFCALRRRVDRDQLIPYLKRMIENNSMFACMRDPTNALARILDWRPIDEVSDFSLSQLALIEGSDVTDYLWRYFQTVAGFEDRRDAAARCRQTIQAEFFPAGWGRSVRPPVNAGDVLKLIEVQTEWLPIEWIDAHRYYRPMETDVYKKYLENGVSVMRHKTSTTPFPSSLVFEAAMERVRAAALPVSMSPWNKEKPNPQVFDTVLRNATVWTFPRHLTWSFFDNGSGALYRSPFIFGDADASPGRAPIPSDGRTEIAGAFLLNLRSIVANSDAVRPHRHAEHVEAVLHFARKSYWNGFARADLTNPEAATVDEAEALRRQLTMCGILGIAGIRTPEGCAALQRIAEEYRGHPYPEFHTTAVAELANCAVIFGRQK